MTKVVKIFRDEDIRGFVICTLFAIAFTMAATICRFNAVDIEIVQLLGCGAYTSLISAFCFYRMYKVFTGEICDFYAVVMKKYKDE